MYLEALPTELDEAILQYLNARELSHMTRVSKYYRKLGDPHLYSTIHLRGDVYNRVKRLLITLLGQK
jgi:hypothetical protein